MSTLNLCSIMYNHVYDLRYCILDGYEKEPICGLCGIVRPVYRGEASIKTRGVPREKFFIYLVECTKIILIGIEPILSL